MASKQIEPVLQGLLARYLPESLEASCEEEHGGEPSYKEEFELHPELPHESQHDPHHDPQYERQHGQQDEQRREQESEQPEERPMSPDSLINVSARSYFLASVAERRCEVSSFNKILDIYHDDSTCGEVKDDAATPPRVYGRAVLRKSLGNRERAKPPTTPLSASTSVDSPSSRSVNSRGTTFKDGQLLRSTPPRHVRVRQSIGSSEKKPPTSTISKTRPAPLPKTPSQSKVTPALSAKTSSQSNLLQIAESARRAHKSGCLVAKADTKTPPPKKTANTQRTSFEPIPESLNLLMARSTDTYGSLDLMFSNSSEGADDASMASGSVISTNSTISGLTAPSRRSTFDGKMRRLSTTKGRAIDNLDNVSSKNDAIMFKRGEKAVHMDGNASTASTVTDATSLLSGLSNLIASQSTRNEDAKKQDAVALLSNVVSLLAAGDGNEPQNATALMTRRQELDRLRRLSTGQVEDVTKKVSDSGATNTKPGLANPRRANTPLPSSAYSTFRGRSTPRAMQRLGGTCESATTTTAITDHRASTPVSSNRARTPISNKKTSTPLSKTKVTTPLSGSRVNTPRSGCAYRAFRGMHTPQANQRLEKNFDSAASVTKPVTPLSTSTASTPLSNGRLLSRNKTSTPLSGNRASTPLTGNQVSTPLSNRKVLPRNKAATPLSVNRASTPLSENQVPTPLPRGKASTPLSRTTGTSSLLNSIYKARSTPRAKQTCDRTFDSAVTTHEANPKASSSPLPKASTPPLPKPARLKSAPQPQCQSRELLRQLPSLPKAESERMQEGTPRSSRRAERRKKRMSAPETPSCSTPATPCKDQTVTTQETVSPKCPDAGVASGRGRTFNTHSSPLKTKISNRRRSSSVSRR